MDRIEVEQAMAAYQVAYDEFHSGRMRWRESDGAPVQALPAAAATAALADDPAKNGVRSTY
jgi:hypothetical protein